MTYAAAGVDIDAAESATDRIRALARETFNQNVLSEIGAFGAAYSLSSQSLKEPVLISSADGVGTKLKIAFAAGRHDTVGQCLVNHCVNDIAVQGASPLFFLDYFSVGKLEPDVVERVLRGISLACRENGLALIGGETAEMSGLYADGEYDLAGFIVGLADRGELLPDSRVQAGCELIGLPSTGLHTNGYSLAREVLFKQAGYGLDSELAGLDSPLGDELLKVHRSYLKPLRGLAEAGLLAAAAHITGGGIPGNLPRVLPAGLQACVLPSQWDVPAIFRTLQREGRIPDSEMRRTFNMGVGLIACVPPDRAEAALGALRALGEPAQRIGRVERGPGGVVYEP